MAAQVQRRWVFRMRHYELMVILDPDIEERTVAPRSTSS